MHEWTDEAEMEKDWLELPGQLEQELRNILAYWCRYTPDAEYGGFVGRIDQENRVIPYSPKGSVLNSRILWTFSNAYAYSRDPEHLDMATRAFQYLRDFFVDPVHGGLYWLVDYRGTLLDPRKQIYAQAFGIYGMSAYYRVVKDPEALTLAREWFELLERYSRDPVHEGYIDAFARDWSDLPDKRLSEKDENAVKTMNTHLHIVEAYVALYEIWPAETLKNRIISLLDLFDQKIIDPHSHHLNLFFSAEWNPTRTLISYGHDIEAAWLLQACAESVLDEAAIRTATNNALKIAAAVREGLDTDGGIWYERNVQSDEWIFEKHWWPQAEALIGWYNAWQLSGDPVYKVSVLKSWKFIRRYLLDEKNGEWYWGVNGKHQIMSGQDKIGIWKCPYHNSRACLELLGRFSRSPTS